MTDVNELCPGADWTISLHKWKQLDYTNLHKFFFGKIVADEGSGCIAE